MRLGDLRTASKLRVWIFWSTYSLLMPMRRRLADSWSTLLSYW